MEHAQGPHARPVAFPLTPRICQLAISPVWPMYVLALRLIENIGVPGGR